MATEPIFLGLDIGGTKCTALAGRASGEVVERRTWPSDASRGPEAMLQDLASHTALLEKQTGPFIRGGVCIGGPLDADAGIIQNPPNLPGWDNIPLKKFLEDTLQIPIQVEHDAAACALAEYQWGILDTPKPSRLAYLTCGTGFGVGLVFDGKIYRGAHGRNLEIGHVRYRTEGPVKFGKQGSYEAFCAGSALPQLAAWKFPQRWNTAAPSSEKLADLAKDDDSDAQEILSINARAVGDACALLADLLVPDIILLGSLARYLGETWLANVQAQFEDETKNSVGADCQIKPANLGDRLQDCSALVVAIGTNENHQP